MTNVGLFYQHLYIYIFQKDRVFEKKLKKCGFILKQMKEDGACLFRAVSDQIFGDQDMHDIVRKQCMDYIVSKIIKSFVKIILHTLRVSFWERVVNGSYDLSLIF